MIDEMTRHVGNKRHAILRFLIVNRKFIPFAEPQYKIFILYLIFATLHPPNVN